MRVRREAEFAIADHRRHRFERRGPLGTVVTITVATRDGSLAAASAIERAVADEIERLGRLHDTALVEILDEASAAVGALNEVVGRRSGRLGDRKDIVLDLLTAGAIVDLAVERVVDDFDPVSVTVSIDGDVVHAVHPGESALVVTVDDPSRRYDDSAPLVAVGLPAGALARSGGGAVASAAVVAHRLSTARIVAQTCVAMEPGEAIDWLESVDGVEALLVDAGGALGQSSGLRRYVDLRS